MIYEMMRAMAGTYLCSITDLYIEHQDILNTLIVSGALVWMIYNKKYHKNNKSSKAVKIMGMTIYEVKDS